MKILIFNAGSSTHKSSLYDIGQTLPQEPPAPLWEAAADWGQNQGQTELKVKANGKTIKTQLKTDDREEVIKELLQTLWTGETRVIENLDAVAVVGHRVVHGGPDFRQSILLDDDSIKKIRELAVFAPLHNSANAAGIEVIRKLKNDMPQVAVFDTAFHSTIPRKVATYPGPASWWDEGIRRYGFHGTSHRYCSRKSAEIVGRDVQGLRLVNCHLGNGSSLAAIRDGKSVDTTMGFTPLEGLMMGTRSGTVDPSILIYLQREKGYDAHILDNMLNKQSGLLGISGISGDMRTIHAAEDKGNPNAILALDMLVYRLRYFIAAMVASLEGIDVLTFTGGIGENDASVRQRVCAGLSYLGIQIDEKLNASSPQDRDISTPDSKVRVLIVHTQEDWEITRDCYTIMQKK
ncbi:acetate kinase [Ktedonobacteria bacterium brp13]|nr:acetate kinase [Ktedonobacteria bacterium brp13]